MSNKIEPSLSKQDVPQWQKEVSLAKLSSEELEKKLSIKSKNPKFAPIIPPLILQKILELGCDSALAKQFLPDCLEENEMTQKQGQLDPIFDFDHLRENGLIHRYSNRALFLPTSTCPIHCRYCFRRNGFEENPQIFKPQKEKIKKYLLSNPEINEIIFTGGDPLILNDARLEEDIKFFSSITSIKYLRLHTRFPTTIPSRITDNFLKTISKVKKPFTEFIFVIHINSAQELFKETKEAIIKLKNTGALLLSQSVLLKGINDTPTELYELYQSLAELGVRPYYLHHPDIVKGAMHFRVTIEEGRKIYLGLKNKLPGWLLPQYVCDLPNGGGKVPVFNSECLEYSGQFINRFGEKTSYQ